MLRKVQDASRDSTPDYSGVRRPRDRLFLPRNFDVFAEDGEAVPSFSEYGRVECSKCPITSIGREHAEKLQVDVKAAGKGNVAHITVVRCCCEDEYSSLPCLVNSILQIYVI